jgi:hypothetical protein
MIINFRNEDDNISYDVSKIEDNQKKAEATIMVNKVGNIEIILEALNFAGITHRKNLEALLQDTPEAMVAESEEDINDNNEEVSEDSESEEADDSK